MSELSPAPAPIPRLTLKGPGSVKVGRGHLWVFSNDMLSVDDGAQQGGEVVVVTAKGEVAGTALFNRHALIMARIFSSRQERFTPELLRQRLADAHQRRLQQYPNRRTYRLVFSESDALPGLIVDQYEDVLSVQFLTLAMDMRRELIVQTLQELCSPRAIVERSDSPARLNEGLQERKGLLYGELPEELVVDINGLKFRVDVMEGQKTGMYLDQVENWALMERYAPGKKVLDLFCYVGGFSLNAARFGAASVKAVDSSDAALSQLMFNAHRNGLTDKIKAKKSDAFLYTRSQPEQFDVIVCDPPPFAKSRKQLDTALRGYRELNRQCLKMLNPGGILISISCSAALSENDFDKMLGIAARDAARQIRLLPGGGQPVDHAPLLSMPETHYLKVRIVQAVD